MDGSCGICDGRGQDWLDSHRIIYNGKEYYSWGGGYGCEFTTQIVNNHIILVCDDGTTLEMELLSDDSLRLVAATFADEYWESDIKVGAIFE